MKAMLIPATVRRSNFLNLTQMLVEYHGPRNQRKFLHGVLCRRSVYLVLMLDVLKWNPCYRCFRQIMGSSERLSRMSKVSLWHEGRPCAVRKPNCTHGGQHTCLVKEKT
jgi:hypothetical protein